MKRSRCCSVVDVPPIPTSPPRSAAAPPRYASETASLRGAPRVPRGAPNAGVWGAISGPPLSEVQSLGQRARDRNLEERPSAIRIDDHRAVGLEEYRDLLLREERQ